MIATLTQSLVYAALVVWVAKKMKVQRRPARPWLLRAGATGSPPNERTRREVRDTWYPRRFEPALRPARAAC